MEPQTAPRLLQQAEKILLHPIHAHLISYCPTMDLVALVTSEENLDVYRLNGQRAFGLKRKSEDVCVQALRWQWNGAGVAVAWSDGSVDVVGAETGRVVHGGVKLPVAGAEGRRVQCMGWGMNFIDAERVKRRTGEVPNGDAKAGGTWDFNMATTEDWDKGADGTTLEEFLQRQPDFERLDVAPDLPEQIAMMDTESLMPKLPVIPLPPANPMMRFMHQQVDAAAFSSQAEVDGLLHSQHLRDHNSVDMFIRCTEDGGVYPSIYDSMEAVEIRLPQTWGVRSKVVMHASHPYVCTHSLVMEVSSPAKPQKRLAWVPLTLGFIPSAGTYLHLIAAKTAQLQNLLAYLSTTLARIQTYFNQTQDLPGKFMANIGETLAEDRNNAYDLVTLLYQLACTGHCPTSIHDWLVDELAEQGHKRWDNAVTSGLATVIQLLHENFLPALDRCSIIISRLKGLAEFHDREWIFSGPLTDFTNLLDVIKTLSLLANTALLYATEEKRHFASFSKWLRYCIDFEATEPGSQSRTEMESTSPGVDIAAVLEYIQYGMATSDVKPYLTKALGASTWARDYDETVKVIEQLREGRKAQEEVLCVENVLLRFADAVRGLLRQVSQWQKNNISMDSGIVLDEGEAVALLDMRMVSEPTTTTLSTCIALRTTPSPSPSLTLHRLTHSPRIPPSAPLPSLSSTTLTIPEHTILDAKFADDTTLLLLLEPSAAEHPYALVAVQYTPTPTADSSDSASLTAHPTHPSDAVRAALLPSGHAVPLSARHAVSLSAAELQAHTQHVFEGRFTPLALVVNGRVGRRVVLVVGSDRKHYRVLDLDFAEGKEEGDGDDGDGEGSDVEMGEA